MAGPQITRLQNPAVAQSYREPVRTVVGDATITDADANGTVLIDATAASRTVTLPAVSGRSGFRITVKKIAGVVANTVTIDGSGAETIDDAANQVLIVQYESLTLVCDGSEWWIV